MIAAAASNLEMMPSVLRAGVESVKKAWKPLEWKGKVLRVLIDQAPIALVEMFTVNQINAAAENLVSWALWFDGARDWLERDSVPCDATMLATARQVQLLVARIRESQRATVAIVRAAFSEKFQTSVRHFEGASQQLLIALADMHRVMVEQCLRGGLIAESDAVWIVGPPSLAETMVRIDEGIATLRHNKLASTRYDAELLAEARQTLEAVDAR